MGAVISRWRHQPSTVEVLEKIDKDIASLERENRGNLERQKRIIGSLVLYSVFFYIIAAVAFYLYYRPHAWQDQLIYCTPLLIFPVLVWGMKVILHWYFVKRITKNELALEELKETKETILENVKETETYKKAKEILEKFAPEKSQHLESPNTARMSPPRQGQDLRQRVLLPQQGVTPQPRMQTPAPGVTPRPMSPPRQVAPPNVMATPCPSTSGQQAVFQRQPPGPPLPCPVLPRDRSTMEMLVEYLVGDGPQNRYALVCRQCHSHNGMALKEDFEYLAFRCCYCYVLNPARRQRPRAPQLNLGTTRRTPENVSAEVSSSSADRDVNPGVKTTEESQWTDTPSSPANLQAKPSTVRRKTSRTAGDDDVTRDTQTDDVTQADDVTHADDVMQTASEKKTD